MRNLIIPAALILLIASSCTEVNMSPSSEWKTSCQGDMLNNSAKMDLSNFSYFGNTDVLQIPVQLKESEQWIASYMFSIVNSIANTIDGRDTFMEDRSQISVDDAELKIYHDSLFLESSKQISWGVSRESFGGNVIHTKHFQVGTHGENEYFNRQLNGFWAGYAFVGYQHKSQMYGSYIVSRFLGGAMEYNWTKTCDQVEITSRIISSEACGSDPILHLLQINTSDKSGMAIIDRWSEDNFTRITWDSAGNGVIEYFREGALDRIYDI